jgi:hypothetical protein
MVGFESGERSCGTGLCPLPKIGIIKAKSRPFVVLRLRDQDIESDEGGRSNSRFLHRTDRQCAWGRNAVRDIGGRKSRIKRIQRGFTEPRPDDQRLAKDTSVILWGAVEAGRLFRRSDGLSSCRFRRAGHVQYVFGDIHGVSVE